MKRIPYLLLAVLCLLLLTACSIQMGYPTNPTDSKPVSPSDNSKVSHSNSPTPPDQTPSTDSQTPGDHNTAPVETTAPHPSASHPYADETVMVKNPQPVVSPGKTFTGNAPLDQVEFALVDPNNKSGLSNEKYSHSFGGAKDGVPHSITVENQMRFDEYGLNAFTWDNKTEEKVLYLTFDCGYEYQNLTAEMLDVLKAKDVPAAFFCTLDYLEQAPTVVARMINEGHIVGNHSTSHPSDCSALSREEMAWELLGGHNYLLANFGYECKYFRFPAGVYSENMLDVAYTLGYRSSFWSVAHADWDPADQPAPDKALQTLISRLHPGAVILLHTTSPTNAAILADYIDYAKAQGYEFRSLSEYEHWDY